MVEKQQDTGVTASSGGRAATASQPSRKGVSGIAGIPNATALVRLMNDYQSIPSRDFYARYPAFVAMREQRKRAADNYYEATFGLFLLIAESLAQGIEAATAGETRSGSTVGESPVAEGDAPNETNVSLARGES